MNYSPSAVSELIALSFASCVVGAAAICIQSSVFWYSVALLDEGIQDARSGFVLGFQGVPSRLAASVATAPVDLAFQAGRAYGILP